MCLLCNLSLHIRGHLCCHWLLFYFYFVFFTYIRLSVSRVELITDLPLQLLDSSCSHMLAITLLTRSKQGLVEQGTEQFFGKFILSAGRLADLITRDSFFGNRLRGFVSVRCQILPFSYLQAVAVNTVLALPRSLWCRQWAYEGIFISQ